MTPTPVKSPSPAPVQRQIVLPTSKAVEIAWKSIRLRLSRSLLVTSGIVLALAFLMSMLTEDALIQGMRQWSQSAQHSPEFTTLRTRQAELEAQLKSLQAPISAAIAKGKPAGKGAGFDPKETFGHDWPELAQELGALPGPASELNGALVDHPPLIADVRQWIDARRQWKAAVDRLNGPQNLEALMRSHGVPTSTAEIASSRIQTRWLLGLALLVAFAGILNAMLMSVTERFREIGTMKCLGALDSFIIKLFVIESLFQGIIGTLAGVLIGLVLSIASAWTAYPGFLWKNPHWREIGMSAAVCFLVGVGLTVAGAVYPAWQAARMQPIDAMRVEA